MKTFIKTIAITLCLSVTMLFFSSSKKVEAASAVVVSGALYVIAAIVTAVAVGLGIEVANEVSDQIKNGENNGSFVVNNDGTVTCDVEAMTGVSEELKPVIIQSVSSFNTSTLPPVFAGGSIATRPSYSVPSKDVNSVVENAFTALYKGSDTEESSSSLGLGVAVVDGKPQKVVTDEAPTKVEIFDYMNLEYTTYSSLFDFQIRHVFDDPSSNVQYGKYYAPYIIKNNNLYVMTNGKETSKSATSLTIAISRSNTYYNFAIHGCSFGIGNYGVGPMSTPHSGISTRLANVDNSLCWAFYSFDGKTTNPSQLQAIFGYPSAPVSYPVLFSDPPSFEYSGVPLRTFNNYVSTDPFVFVNPANETDVLSESDVLQSNFDTCGYFISDSPTAFNFSNSIGTAAKMMSGTEGNAVSGGTKTTYSELSDLEKALYALAEQQGITYEQMLEQSNIVIENGEMYIEGLDGVQHSIESLLSEFEKLLEQGSISNEQGSATVEQLTALLTYLKSLNIEGINKYISQIESTLDDLNSSSKDSTAVLGDVLGQLEGLSSYLDSLGLSSVGSDISQIKSEVQTRSKAIEDFIKEEEERRKKEDEFAANVIKIIGPSNTSYPLYDQCKFLIDNLFNYDDVLQPPNFSFYWDSNGDGVSEEYNPFDLSFLEMELTGKNLVDKSLFPVEIKVIDVIRYVIAIVIYGLFVMRLLKRLPTFYGFSPLTRL